MSENEIIRNRLPRWPEKFEEFLRGRLNTPFKWGRNDCCLLVADSIQVLTGKDMAGFFRGRYNTRAQAFKLIKEFCDGSIAELFEKIAEIYELPEIPASDMVVGDIGLIKAVPLDPIAGKLSNGLTIAIKSFDDMIMLSPGKDGLVLSKNPEVIKAWAI